MMRQGSKEVHDLHRSLVNTANTDIQALVTFGD